MIRRPIDTFRGEAYFRPEMPIFVNRAVESFDIIEHQHDFLEISYVGEGSGTHYIGDRTLQVHQGDIFLIPVGVSHVFRPSSASRARALVVYNCVLESAFLRPLIRNFPGGDLLETLLDENDWRRFRDTHGEFRRLFLKLHDEYASMRPGWHTGLLLGVMELLLRLYRSVEKPAEASRNAGSPGLEAALYLIHTRFDGPIALREAAEAAALGERQFLRKFKARTGMTFVDYVQSVRIDEACRLLRSTDRKVADIASAVGYQDVGHFNRLFRRRTGRSPRAYRKAADVPPLGR